MGKQANASACPTETELRLAGDRSTLEILFDSPLIASEDGTPEKIADLASCYFDTEDQQLHARKLALRVRHDSKGSRRQTLKAADDDQTATLTRREWEMAVDQDSPVLDALPKDARALLPKSAKRKGGLRKAFETRIKRRTRKIAVNGADAPAGMVEVALDVGEIVTEAGSVPIAEIELELLEGAAPSLYELALALQTLGPVRLETRSKSVRAYDKLADVPPSWHHATMPSLAPSNSVDDAMAAIFARCYEQWLANQAAAIDGTDPEGVHQMRIGLRRLRSALSIFSDVIPEQQLIWLKEGAKETADVLGPPRDWDVFQSDLLAPIHAARPEDKTLRLLANRARQRCQAGYRQAGKQFAETPYNAFALRVGQWIEGRQWRGQDATRDNLEQTIDSFARKTLGKRHSKALKAGESFATLTTEQRHELRIILKKLRYSLEFFTSLFSKKSQKPFLASTKALQNDLGHLNDIAVAEKLLATLQASARKPNQDLANAAGLVIGWHAHGYAMIEPQLQRHWEHFARQPAFWK